MPCHRAAHDPESDEAYLCHAISLTEVIL